MKKIINLVFVVFLSLTVLLSGFVFFPLTVYAEEEDWPPGPEVVAESAILIEASTGAVLYNKNMNQQMYPASITKILTALVALENSSMDDTVVFSSAAVNSLEEGAANIGINEGDSLSMEDAMYALLLHSANEVANAIAENISGNTADFVKLMNNRAKEIGALNTNFENPSGLFDENHYTTCYDMALITRECLKNSTFMKIDSTSSYTINGTELTDTVIEFTNRNKMLIPGNAYYYEGTIGGKTGYLSQSGRTLISICKRNNMTLISVVMNTNTENQFKDAQMLMDYGFNNFNLLNISENETHFSSNGTGFLSAADSIMDSGFSSEYSLGSSDYVVLPKDIPFSATQSLLKVVANGEHGVVATIEYSYKGSYIGKTNLTLPEEPLSSSTNPFLISEVKDEGIGLDWQIRINIWYVFVFLILLTFFFIIRRNLNFSNFSRSGNRYKKRKKKKRLHF